MRTIRREDIEILSRCTLFEGIDFAEIESMVLSANPVEKTFYAGSIVALAGEAYERLLLILEGVLTTEITDYRGKILKLERFKKSHVIASSILFAADNTLPVQILTESDVRVLFFSKRSIIAMCRDNGTFLNNYLREGGDRIKLLAAKLRFHQFHTIRQKIAVYFLDLSSSQGTNNVRLPYSIETLSEIFGAARPALSRCLGEMVAKGLLSRIGREYTIEDKEGLIDLVGG